VSPVPDVLEVGELVRAIGLEELLPRHRALESHQIHAKPSESDPEDIVTEADLTVERRLGPALAALLPGSRVVGEEAVAQGTARVETVGAEAPVWVVDPLDGTRNFAAGAEGFGTMVALVHGGETVAAWIHLTLTDRLYCAERGSGSFCDGLRLDAAAAPPTEPPVGTLYTGFMPGTLRSRVESAAAGAFAPRPIPGSAAIEYTNLLAGRKDFAVYFRLHPWDHAPGALLLEEAGGAVRHADGRPYRPTAPHGLTLVARDRRQWPVLQGRLGLGGLAGSDC